MYKKSKKLSTSTVQSQKKTGKARQLICYAIVNKVRPRINVRELYDDKDVRILSTEKMIKVVINEL